MTVHMHYVIEVTGATAFAERTQLLPEEFHQRVADDSTRYRQRVAVLVSDGPKDRLFDENLIARDVELDFGELPR